MIHLDTSFLIRCFAGGTPQSGMLDQWIDAGEVLCVSSIAWFEFLCGPLDASSRSMAEAILGAPLAFESSDAGLAATLFNASGRRRGSRADCMIAAVAIRWKADLATENARDFRVFEMAGLRLA